MTSASAEAEQYHCSDATELYGLAVLTRCTEGAVGDDIPDIDFGIMPGASIVQNDSAKSRILHIEYRIDDFHIDDIEKRSHEHSHIRRRIGTCR